MKKPSKQSTLRKPLFYTVLIALLTIALVVVWCIFHTPTVSSPTQPASSQSSSTAQPTQPTPPPETTNRSVSIFFSRHPESDDDPGRTFAVPRTAPNNDVINFAISELLQGPSVGERDDGYFATARIRSATEPSTCDNRDFSISIQATVATLTFCRTFDHVGEISDGQAESELKATLLQFPSIKKVIILNSRGDCEFNLSGQNLCKQ